MSLLGRFGRAPIGYTLYGSSSGVAAARDSTCHGRSTELPDGGVGTQCALRRTVVKSHRVALEPSVEGVKTATTCALMLRCSYHLHAARCTLFGLPGICIWTAASTGYLGMRTREEDGDMIVIGAVHKALPPAALVQALDGLTCHMSNAFQGENQKLAGSLPHYLHSTKCTARL